jgi:hypothetical protein
MKRIIGALVVAVSVITAITVYVSPSMAADTDTIDSVSDDGSTITMQSGPTYDSDDSATSSTWQSGDDVTVTNDDTIVNTDEGGESVEGTEE